MRDIHVGKRRSEAANEEQSDKLRKKVRFEQEALLLWNILRVVRHKLGRGPYLSRSQVMLMTTNKFLRWVHSTKRMDERVVTSEKCWSGTEEKMPEISRKLNELVENWTCLNLQHEKSWKTWKSNQEIVMDEELVQNIVMNERLVQNGVMNEGLVQNGVMNGGLVQNGVKNLIRSL